MGLNIRPVILLVLTLAVVASAIAATDTERDDDFNSSATASETRYNGYVNKLEDMSNQLEDSSHAQMDTNVYYEPGTPQPSFWNNSDGSQDAADQYAITPQLNWSLSSRGVPYPPFGTYYRDNTLQYKRTLINSSSIGKSLKVFGNSYAAISEISATDQNGNDIEPNDGVWLDPDNFKDLYKDYKLTEENQDTSEEWMRAIKFKMDITGPDSGIGVDHDVKVLCPFPGQTDDDGRCAAVFGEVFFQRKSSDVSQVVPELERPVCGDDRREFLIEEAGESKNPEIGDGRFGCVRSSTSCYAPDNLPGERFVEEGEYGNAQEPGEDEGRLKEDNEICVDYPGLMYSVWYDQDYSQQYCKDNTLYGDEGIRWFDEDYVSAFPQTVSGGIDDSWNRFLEQQNETNYTSPVPTGQNATVPDDERVVANTIGFCGGDDGSEYLVTQECRTGLCETNRRIQGVAKDPGSCVFEPSTLNSGYSTEVSQRTLYQPGEKITIDTGNDEQTIACFNNLWYENWPIVFSEDSVDVSFSESSRVSFEVINVRTTQQTFKVSMEPGSEIYRHSQFAEESGDSFTTTIPAESSKTFHVEIQGADRSIDSSELTVMAEGVNSDSFGEDYLQVSVVENNLTNSSVRRTEPQSVPGIGTIHLIFIILLSSAAFFLQS